MSKYLKEKKIKKPYENTTWFKLLCHKGFVKSSGNIVAAELKCIQINSRTVMDLTVE